MKKRLLFTIIFINCMVMCVQGQSSIRLNNFLNNTQHINPATVYDQYSTVFTAAGRMQWLGMTGAPKTLFAAATTYLEQFNTQLTLRLIQDKIGYTSSTNIAGAYAYAFNLNKWSQLHMGLGVSYRTLNYDQSKVNLENKTQIDPEVEKYLQQQSSYNAELGIEYSTKYLKIGLSNQNIMSLFKGKNWFEPNTSYAYAKYRQNSNTYVDLGGGICGIKYDNIYQAEIAVSAYFRTQSSEGLIINPDVFDVSLFYRTRNELGFIVGYNITDNFYVSYSYDYNFGDISRTAYGTNEITLTYRLNRRHECKTCWY